jgi:glycosyltransferase involved in cell wall biosynthesis
MKILFVHNNFPAQFVNLAATLAEAEGVELAAIGCETSRAVPGVKLLRYRTPRGVAQAHTFARRFDNECRRAEEVLYAATKLLKEGFHPDLVFVHPGWGENLPLRGLFPAAKIVVFCEYYYRREGGDIGFDPEFPTMGVDGFIGLELRNAATLLALASADAALAPTHWQKSTYPKAFHPLISVIHEGVDTDFFAPDSTASLRLPDGTVLSAGQEILTYTSRNFEPMRGFHSFMRALPLVLERRPRAQILIVGENGVSYGAPPRKHPDWKAAMLDEVGERLDFSRVHILARQSLSTYLKVLQISAAHVYLTYPFVLSWSMLEAMSAGCLVVGSETPPVVEVIDGANGLLAPMFDIEALAERIVDALSRPEAYRPLRKTARRTIVENFDARAVCGPKLLEFVEQVSGTPLKWKRDLEFDRAPLHAEV